MHANEHYMGLGCVGNTQRYLRRLGIKVCVGVCAAPHFLHSLDVFLSASETEHFIH